MFNVMSRKSLLHGKRISSERKGKTGKNDVLPDISVVCTVPDFRASLKNEAEISVINYSLCLSLSL